MRLITYVHQLSTAMHQAAIIVAKFKINLLSPIISKIPPELMVVIFSFVKDKSGSGGRGK